MPTLETDEATLHYEMAGEGEPLLFLHGLGSSSADWRYQIEHFARTHRCIALDARGSGASRDKRFPAGPFTVRDFARDAATLLDRLDLAPAHVVGLSMGGMIAFQLAVDQPRVVRTLTIVNSGPALVPRSLKDHVALTSRLFMARFLGPARMGRILAPKLFPGPGHASLRAEFEQRMAANDPRAYLATTRAIIGWSVSDRIGEIDVPTLVVSADGDYTPVEIKREYARRMRRAEVVVVPDSRHALPVEAPEKFNPVLERFLAAHAEIAE